MHPYFSVLTDQLDPLLQELKMCDPIVGCPDRKLELPNRAVYLFSHGEDYLYVGRTNRLRARIKEHLRGRNNDAPFAFKMARHATDIFKGKGQPTRKELEAHPKFSKAFALAKDGLAAMEWRYVMIDDPNLQCLFEIYASICLDARFNDFENH